MYSSIDYIADVVNFTVLLLLLFRNSVNILDELRFSRLVTSVILDNVAAVHHDVLRIIFFDFTSTYLICLENLIVFTTFIKFIVAS